MSNSKTISCNIFLLWEINAQKAITSGKEVQYELEEDKACDFSPE